MSEARALRYRKLALAEQDPDIARLLRLIADEAETGVLCVFDWQSKTGPTNVPIGSEPKT